MKLKEENNSFHEVLKNVDFKNIDTGFIENNLFGDSDEISDENGVMNRKIKIFYFIKKAKLQNAPYLVFLNGGPGIAITDMFFQYQYFTFLPNINVIFFDQRGTGLSDKPSTDINELKYYSAKYILSDAEKIREKILGKNSKWTVFGQSYGGIIARKYIENKPYSINRVITHGSAKYDAIDVAVNTELNTIDRLNGFFSKYPEDLQLIQRIKSELLESDSLSSDVFLIQGKNLIHILAILYSVKSDEDFHLFLTQLNKENIKDSFLNAIKHLSSIILDTGLLNQAVAQIDMIGYHSPENVSYQIKEMLASKGVDLKSLLISKQQFDDSLVTISADLKELENKFKNGQFTTDVIDLDLVHHRCIENGIYLDIFGGTTDMLAFNSIKNEELYFKNKTKKSFFINYHYTDGHHREWLTNSSLFEKLVE